MLSYGCLKNHKKQVGAYSQLFDHQCHGLAAKRLCYHSPKLTQAALTQVLIHRWDKQKHSGLFKMPLSILALFSTALPEASDLL